MKRFFAWFLSACFAVALALLLTTAFEIVEVRNENMSPDFQHGDRALVWKLGVENIAPGDLVLCRVPFHQQGSPGLYSLMRVAYADEDSFSVCKFIGDTPKNQIKIFREDVVGRVLIKVP